MQSLAKSAQRVLANVGVKARTQHLSQSFRRVSQNSTGDRSSYRLFFSERTEKQFSLFGLGAVGTILAFGVSQVSADDDEKKENSEALSPTEWRSLEIAQIMQLNHNTKVFRFQLPEGTTLSLPIASYILIKAPTKEGEQELIRPYTPVSTTEQHNITGYVDLMVKGYPQGNVSKYLHSLNVGDKVLIKGPMPSMPYTPNMKNHIGMIAGGTGITPMLQIISRILDNPQDRTKITLVFANIAAEDILAKQGLEARVKANPNFKIYYILEKPPKNWKEGVGYVSETIIKQQLPPPSDDTLIMVCGPPPMMNAISGPKNKDKTQGELKGLLKSTGYKENQVWKF